MRKRAFAVVLALVWTLAVTAPLAAHQTDAQPSLYQRLGGYDAIAAVVDDFIGRMVADPQLAPFFAGHSTESLKRIRQLVVDQLCAATGGPCYYTGRSMKASHEGLKVTPAHWDAAVKHLTATLDKFKVGAKEREEVFAAVGGLRADIVAP
jgi:hemoglobin